MSDKEALEKAKLAAEMERVARLEREEEEVAHRAREPELPEPDPVPEVKPAVRDEDIQDDLSGLEGPDLWRAALPSLSRQAIRLARLSDNLPQVLGVMKEISDRLHGRPEQGTALKDPAPLPNKSLAETARAFCFAIRAAQEGGEVIDLSPVKQIGQQKGSE